MSPRRDSDAALIAYIRASLIRLLLGRRFEKRQLGGGIREKPEGYLTLYGVCGDEQACVHDFPEQTRQLLTAPPPGELPTDPILYFHDWIPVIEPLDQTAVLTTWLPL